MNEFGAQTRLSGLYSILVCLIGLWWIETIWLEGLSDPTVKGLNNDEKPLA